MSQIMYVTKVGMFVTLISIIFMNDPNDPSVLLSERVFTIYSLLMAVHVTLAVNFTYGCLLLFEHKINIRRLQVG